MNSTYLRKLFFCSVLVLVVFPTHSLDAAPVLPPNTLKLDNGVICKNVAADPCAVNDSGSVNAVEKILGQLKRENLVPKSSDTGDEALALLRDGTNPAKSGSKATGKAQINTVAKLLEMLPLSMRANSILLGPSRSNQDGSTANPKVILKSPNSDAIVSFNSHPGQHGSNEAEMMVWNKERQAYDFISVHFAEGLAGASLRKQGLSAEVRTNPGDCLVCHGDPGRAKWDPGAMWPGQIPFAGDKILGDNNLNTREYLSLVTRMEKARATHQSDLFADRMKSVVMPSSKQVLDGIKNGSGVVIPNKNEPGGKTLQCNTITSNGVETTGSASRMYDQLDMKNWCSIASELKKDKNWKNIKYAVLGALDGCVLRKDVAGKTSSFLPPGMQKDAIQYFQAREKGVPLEKSIADDPIGFLQRDLSHRYSHFQNDREALETSIMVQHGGKEADFLKWQEIDNFNRNTDFTSENVSKVAGLRYILEPMGVEVNRWSIAVDQNNYTMGNLVGLLKAQPLLKEVQAEIPKGQNACEWLAHKSSDTLSHSGNGVRALEKRELASVCSVNGSKDLQFAVNSVSTTKNALIHAGMQNSLQKCITCHSSKDDFAGGAAEAVGAPRFSMVDKGTLSFDKLEKMIRSMPSEKFGNASWANRIWARVSRPQDAPGAMPQKPAQSLSENEKQNFLNWLKMVDPGFSVEKSTDRDDRMPKLKLSAHDIDNFVRAIVRIEKDDNASQSAIDELSRKLDQIDPAQKKIIFEMSRELESQ